MVGVNGKEVAFNIDLMHPSDVLSDRDLSEREMFADIMELDIMIRPGERMMSQSIIFPASNIIFSEQLYAPVHFSAVGFDGSEKVVQLKVLDGRGSILSKCSSASSKKRTRDSFDIFYALTGENALAVGDGFKALCEKHPPVAIQRERLASFVDDGTGSFERNVGHHVGKTYQSGTATKLLKSLIL